MTGLTVVAAALAAPSVTPGWSVTGSTHAKVGIGIAFLDANGDGYDEVAVGHDGSVHLHLGSIAGAAAAEAQALAAVDAGSDTLFGWALAAADFDRDGYDDLVAGDPNALPGGQGQVYLFRGGPNGLSAAPDWSHDGRRFGFGLGAAVHAVGDPNADGFPDLLAAADGDPTVLLLFPGGPAGFGPPVELAVDRDLVLGGRAAGADVDCDGVDDLVVGGEGSVETDETDEGVVVVFRGVPGGPEPVPAWTKEADEEGALLVAAAGDVDGDGCADVVTARQLGRVELFRGTPAGLEAAPSWTWVDPTARCVDVALGDYDGDGDDDLWLGLPYEGDGPELEGLLHLFRADAQGLPAAPTLVIEGEQDFLQLGVDVALDGDTNGDGRVELYAANPVYDAAGYVALWYDRDGDGALDALDCDPADPAIVPGGTEIVGNGVDETCDGLDAERGIADLAPGDLAITEVMLAPVGVEPAEGQWVEIASRAAAPVDLVGLELLRGYTIGSSVVIAPGERLVLGPEADPARNGGLPAVVEVPGLGWLADDELALWAGDTRVDAIALAALPFEEGAATARDPELDRWCAATSSYGALGNRGTPGAANDPCPPAEDEDPPATDTGEVTPAADPPARERAAARSGCGCAGAPAPAGLLAPALLALLHLRRRSRRPRCDS